MQYKRKFQRYPIQTPLKYQGIPAARSQNSSCCDISHGGVSFLAKEPLAKGALVQITLPVHDRVFKRSGRVAYSNHVAGIGMYRTGIEFQDQAIEFNTKLEYQQSQIKTYQEELSQELKRPVSDEEATRRWVDKYMRQFSTLF